MVKMTKEEKSVKSKLEKKLNELQKKDSLFNGIKNMYDTINKNYEEGILKKEDFGNGMGYMGFLLTVENVTTALKAMLFEENEEDKEIIEDLSAKGTLMTYMGMTLYLSDIYRKALSIEKLSLMAAIIKKNEEMIKGNEEIMKKINELIEKDMEINELKNKINKYESEVFETLEKLKEVADIKA